MLRLLALLALVPGCFGSSVTPFPDGLEPLAENQAAWPDAPGTVEWAEGREEVGDDRDWVHARLLVDADLATTLDALRLPEVCEDRRRIDAIEVEWHDPPTFDVGFTTHNEVYDIVTVAWSNEWRLGVVEGTVAAPEVVAVRYQKTEGSDLIELLRGSVVAAATDEGWTALDVVRELEARTTGTEEIRGYIEDFLAEIELAVRGEPLPEYE